MGRSAMAAIITSDFVFMFFSRLRCEPHWQSEPDWYLRAGFDVVGQALRLPCLDSASDALALQMFCCLRNSCSLAGNWDEHDFLARIGNTQRRARVWIAPLQGLALLITNPAHGLVVASRKMQTFVACVVNNLGCTRWNELGSSDCRSRRRGILRDRCPLRRTIHSDARENQKHSRGSQT